MNNEKGDMRQPPSGGCVLKQNVIVDIQPVNIPAAFGRLCVETVSSQQGDCGAGPAAFGRLCVETYPWP